MCACVHAYVCMCVCAYVCVKACVCVRVCVLRVHAGSLCVPGMDGKAGALVRLGTTLQPPHLKGHAPVHVEVVAERAQAAEGVAPQHGALARAAGALGALPAAAKQVGQPLCSGRESQ